MIREITNLNDDERERFRKSIMDRLAELKIENALGKDGQQTVVLDQQSVGRLSRMDALQSQAMARATQSRRDMETRRLEGALVRIADDEFGYCEDCGDAIAKGRLEFDPAVTQCISCASG